MNYMGGKHRQGKKISEFVKHVLTPDKWYIEPFCGALGVAMHVDHPKVFLSDVSEALINMWVAFKNPSLELPDVVTEEEYNQVKKTRNPKDWRTAYYGFGMSFGSKYWGGYARNEAGTNYAANLKRSTNLKRFPLLQTCVMKCKSYDQLHIPRGSVVYCDPPYAGRVKPYDSGAFDHTKYWDWVRDRAGEGSVMIVTEFTIPDDFVVLHNFGDTVVRHYSGLPKNGTSEVIACHESQSGMWGGV